MPEAIKDPDELIAMLLHVMSDYPKGMSLSQVKQIVQQRFGRTLEERDFRVTKLTNLFKLPSLSHIFSTVHVLNSNVVLLKPPVLENVPQSAWAKHANMQPKPALSSIGIAAAAAANAAPFAAAMAEAGMKVPPKLVKERRAKTKPQEEGRGSGGENDSHQQAEAPDAAPLAASRPDEPEHGWGLLLVDPDSPGDAVVDPGKMTDDVMTVADLLAARRAQGVDMDLDLDDLPEALADRLCAEVYKEGWDGSFSARLRDFDTGRAAPGKDA